MKLIIFILIFPFFLFAQKQIAYVTTTSNQSAYADFSGKICYIENPDDVIKEHICPYKDSMARARRNSKFYYINYEGKPVINTEFEKAEDFFEDLAEVRVNGKWGFINKKGDFIIKPQFYETKKFSCGLASAAMSPKGQHGYIDKTGNYVIEQKFDIATPFNTNLAWVYVKGKWGLINKKGIYLISPKYLEYKSFNEGYTWVKKDGLWGMIDSLDNYIIQPNERNQLIYAKNSSFRNFNEFSDGLMIFQSRNMYGFLDKNLKVKITALYDEVYNFKNGLALVIIDKDWGIIDSTGKTVIPIKYKELKLSNSDVFPAKGDNGLWGYINLKNKWIIKPQFKDAQPFEPAFNN